MSAHSIWNSTRRRVSKSGRPDAVRSAEPVVEALKTLIVAQPFFKGLSPEHLQVLAESAQPTEFAAGQLIFRRGDSANRFYLIESGKVAVELERRDREPILVQTIGSGGELGWSWMLPPYYEHFTATALEPAKAVFFHGTGLRECCAENHDLGYELMKRMAEVMLHRIQAATKLLLEATAV
jgi:CRP/FNR family cyclic AMP-dependent transcriptional regulator